MSGQPQGKDEVTVQVRFLDERIKARPPQYATPGAAGMDLRAAIAARRSIPAAPGVAYCGGRALMRSSRKRTCTVTSSLPCG